MTVAYAYATMLAMSRTPHHENRSQAFLYQAGKLAKGTDTANTMPDHKVRRAGAEYLGERAAFGALAALALYGAIQKLPDVIDRAKGPDMPKLEAEYTVQPGDHPWSIAVDHTPKGEDPRGVYIQLTPQPAFRDDGVLTPGETLQVPTTTEAQVVEMSQQPGMNHDTPGNPGS